MNNYKQLQHVNFPSPTSIKANMMPIIMGDPKTVPFKEYLPMIDACSLEKGTTVYLSVKESWVEKGQSQRRAGLHTEAFKNMAWGGGSWGSSKGIYMASTQAKTTRIYDCLVEPTHHHGALAKEPDAPSELMKANTMYWFSDRVPHEAIIAKQGYYRQWFRLVSEEISGWYSRHSTPNPYGVLPNAPILDNSKFEQSTED